MPIGWRTVRKLVGTARRGLSVIVPGLRRATSTRIRFPRVALGPRGRPFLDGLCAALADEDVRFFRGCARDEWAGGINLQSDDFGQVMRIADEIAGRTGCEIFFNQQNTVYHTRAAFEKGVTDPLYFSILVVERDHEGVRFCSYVDVHLWRKERSYGSNEYYTSSSTAPVVSRLRGEAMSALLETTADLSRDRDEILQTARFPIDVVYTWVDDTDPDWLARKDAAAPDKGGGGRSTHPERFRNRDELKYSLRSLDMFAPFVRKIFIVTADQVPDWLDTDHPQVEVVSHSRIYRNDAVLPTFNSSGIESQLHHIPGLSEHFLYFNDDFMLGAFCTPDDFFHSNGAMMFFPSEQVAYEPDIDSRREAYIVADANVIRLMKRDHGRFSRAIMKHAPYPSRRSLLEDLERRYQAEFDACAANRFRADTDIRAIAFMQYNFGYAECLAYPSNISHRYLALWKETIANQLAGVLRRRTFKTLCINDVGVPADRVAEVDALVDDFLRSYFPFPSPFEKDRVQDG